METVITVDKSTDPDATIQQLKNYIGLKDTGGSHNQYQQDQLKLALKDNNKVQIKEINIEPMFMVTELRCSLTDEYFFNDIVSLNREIEHDLKCTVADKIKIVAKRKMLLNQNKENA